MGDHRVDKFEVIVSLRKGEKEEKGRSLSHSYLGLWGSFYLTSPSRFELLSSIYNNSLFFFLLIVI